MELKPKMVLKSKGQTANLPTLKQARITLQWNDNVDLDLMVFGKKKDGTPFSIFTKLLQGDQGDLNTFPFIQLDDDAGVGASSGTKEENITIAQIDPIVDEINVVCLNYSDASQNKNSSFSKYDATINIINDNGDCLVQGQLNDTTSGVAAHLCTIKNSAIGATFTNQNKVLEFADFIKSFPGSEKMCN